MSPGTDFATVAGLTLLGLFCLLCAVSYFTVKHRKAAHDRYLKDWERRARRARQLRKEEAADAEPRG